MKGFTLIEIVLSIAIIGILGLISAPVYQSLQLRNDLDTSAAMVGQNLRRAVVLSRAVDGDSTWGVALQSNVITLFKGVSFATRDVAFDEVTAIPGSIASSGLTEVVMAKMTGLPSTSGNFILTANASNSRTVSLNSQGMVGY